MVQTNIVQIAIMAVTLAVWPTEVRSKELDNFPTGLLARQPLGLSLRSVRLVIGSARVTFEYSIENTTKGSLSTEMVLSSPPYYFSPVEDWGPSLSGPRVEAEGEPIALAAKTAAFRQERDVTAILLAARIDIKGMAHVGEVRDVVAPDGSRSSETAPSQLESLPAEVVDRLLREGLIYRTQVADMPLFPGWSVRESYSWRQVFPAGRVVRIRLQYEPRGRTKHGLADDVMEACGSQIAWKGLRVAPDTRFEIGRIGISLRSFKAWNGSIGSFDIEMEVSESQWVLLCWPGEARWRKLLPSVLRLDHQSLSEDIVVDFIRPLPP